MLLCALPTRVSAGYTAPVSAALLITLGLLTWRQSHDYSDIETLWRATIERNPSAWMPHYNLGVIYGQPCANKRSHLSTAPPSRLPDLAKAHANLATELEKQPGGLAEALSEYQAALRLEPEQAYGHSTMDLHLGIADRLTEAVAQLEHCGASQRRSVEAK